MKITLQDIATYFCITKHDLSTMIHKGKFPKMRSDGDYWESEDLRRWCFYHNKNLDLLVLMLEIVQMEIEVKMTHLKRKMEFLEKEMERVKTSDIMELFVRDTSKTKEHILLVENGYECGHKELDEPGGSIWPARSKQTHHL